MSNTEQLSALLAPAVSAAGLMLYDVTFGGGVLQVLVTSPAGVELDRLGELTREVSRVLDEHDPISGRYTLEVSSPGLERTLRTPAHFAGALGEAVSIKTAPDAGLPRRVRGTLRAADAQSVTVETDAGEQVVVPLVSLVRARTVFEWGKTKERAS